MEQKGVFISYLRENEREVQRLYAELTSRGVQVWLDRYDIDPGAFWPDAIRSAIKEGQFFIACFSEEYNPRTQTCMNEELYFALEMLRLQPDGQKWFIPVLLSPGEVPNLEVGGRRTLRDLQGVALHHDWNDGIQRILQLIGPSEPALPEGITGQDGAKMVLIPAGEFQMGRADEPAADHEQPVHTVSLDAFYMDVHTVTNAQYRQFVAAIEYPAPEYWDDASFNQPNQPVVGVTWYDAMAYAEWAEERLPSEAEWEKAGRGGLVGQKYPWGDEEPDDKMANYAGTVGKTTPVGTYPPNGYGLHDIAGNVWEWCLDEYQSDFYSTTPKDNPLAGGNLSELCTNYKDITTGRVLRGGSWYLASVYLGVAARNWDFPGGRFSLFGFRCVCCP